MTIALPSTAVDAGPERRARVGEPIPLPPLLTLVGSIPMVGRVGPWRALQDAWTKATSGARQVILMPGDAGAGKTRLVTEFARHVHHDGAAVLYGTCSEEQTVPYQPFAEAVDHVVASLDPVTVSRYFGTGAAELARLVPRRAAGLGLPVPVGRGDPDAERARLFGAVISLITEVADGRPLLLVLDDLHWARRPTIDLVDELVHDQTLRNVLIVCSYRSAPADTGEALRSALPELRRSPGVTRVRLGGFDTEEIADFVEAAAGHGVGRDLEAAVDLLARETDGNPFLLVELWLHLIDTGRLARRNDRWTVVRPLTDVASPEGVRDVVAARLGRLVPPARRTLAMAAVIGPTFDAVVLAAVAGEPVATVMTTLDVAVQSRIVSEYGSGGYRFAHELIRRSIRDGLGSAERRRLHLAVARALDTGAASDPIAAIAQHLCAAVPLVEAEEAVSAAVKAADAATAAVAYDDAARFLEAAASIAPNGRVELLLRIADATMRAGDVARAKERCLEAHELAQRTTDPAGRIAAALAYGEAAWRDARDGTTAARLLRGVLPLADDETTRVRLQASLTRALALAGEGDAARVLGEDTLASARTLDDPDACRLAFEAMSVVPWTPQTLDARLAEMREAANSARALLDLEWEDQALVKTLYGEILAGDLDAARRTARRHREVSTSAGQPLFKALDCQAHVLLAVGEGRFAEAEALATTAEELSRSLSGAATGGYGVQLFSIRREQGRLDEARPIVEAVARLDRARSTWRPALAVMYAELGLRDEAIAEIDVLVADQLAVVPRDALWSGSLSYLGDACCAVGHHAGAAAVYDELIEWRGLVVQVGYLLAAHGAVDRLLGKLGAVLGHEREAEIHFEAGLRIDESTRMPVWLAHSQLDYGTFLVGRPRQAEVERGIELLGAALATAERVGMGAVAASARAALDANGGQPQRPEPDAAGLTDREVTVLALIAEGRTNREISERLHISQHTAANHVRSILMKTQCANRTEAAAWALRRTVPADRQGAARNASG
jgi:DNA-binding CsgD family transcriptional regulator/tetratricopeptide (TPR) repeat protein